VQTLSRALHEEVTFDRSRVTSVDWASYPILAFPKRPDRRDSDRPAGPAAAWRGRSATAPVAAAVATRCSMRPESGCGTAPLTPSAWKAALAADRGNAVTWRLWGVANQRSFGWRALQGSNLRPLVHRLMQAPGPVDSRVFSSDGTPLSHSDPDVLDGTREPRGRIRSSRGTTVAGVPDSRGPPGNGEWSSRSDVLTPRCRPAARQN